MVGGCGGGGYLYVEFWIQAQAGNNEKTKYEVDEIYFPRVKDG